VVCPGVRGGTAQGVERPDLSDGSLRWSAPVGGGTAREVERPNPSDESQAVFSACE